MLTSSASEQSSRRDTVKSLTSTLPTAESKTPESEDIIPPSNPVKVNISNTAKSSKSSKSSKSVKKEISTSVPSSDGISIRAEKVKKQLLDNDVVSAVLLKSNGSSEEIEYNISSSSINKLLSGRPTIIGELEDIQVIIVRALSIYTKNKDVNKHILPTPFCNDKYNGDYLLYRVNSNGKIINFTLNEFNNYKESTKTLTANAQKNYNPIDHKVIKSESVYNSPSRLTLIMLRSEADKKVREEFKEKYNRNPTESEVEESVNLTLQKLIDDLVKESDSSPMNDPDYNPKDDNVDGNDESKYNEDNVEQNILKRVKEIYQKENNGIKISAKSLNEQIKSLKVENNNNDNDEQVNNENVDWRIELNEALKYVRARGRYDGKKLAQKISDTFIELNGNEPSLEQLIDVFRRIKNELSNEAKEDMILNENNGSAYSLAKKIGPNFTNADPADLVDYAFRIVREDLVSRARSTFMISKGRTPNKKELEETINKLTAKLGVEALEYADKSVNQFNQFDEDGDYDPNNNADQSLYKKDEIENKEFDDNYFNLKMLQSTVRKSKEATKYNVYFSKFTKKQENRNLLKAIDIFKLRNKREPTMLEINNLKQFLKQDKNTSLVQFKLSVVSDDESNVVDVNNDEEEKEMEELSTKTTPSKILITPVKKKKTSARFDVYLDDKFDIAENEKFAIKWFKRFNNRSPTDDEINNIKQFVKADKSGLTVCNFDVPVVDTDDKKEVSTPIKMTTKSVLNKKKGTKYVLNFDDDRSRDNGDKNKAMKWFKRFNNRSPKKDEKEKISKFIKSDKQLNDNDDTDIVDID